MAKSLRSKVKRAVRAERRVAMANSPLEAKRQANREAAMAKILEAAEARREQAKLDGTSAMDIGSGGGGAAAAGNTNNNKNASSTTANAAATTDEVSWSKLGIRAGGVDKKKLPRYANRSRGKGRGPRRVSEVGAAALNHTLATGNKAANGGKNAFLYPSSNPKNSGKKRRKTSIFTRHGL